MGIVPFVVCVVLAGYVWNDGIGGILRFTQGANPCTFGLLVKIGVNVGILGLAGMGAQAQCRAISTRSGYFMLK